MYYVNLKRIEQRSQFIHQLVQSMEQLSAQWVEPSPTHAFAQERILHLSIECVTDIGSDLIDGLMMRDAGSYEDIIEILLDEQVVDSQLAVILTELVKLRKPLMQEYVEWNRKSAHPLLSQLPGSLRQFTANVDAFLRNQPIPLV